MVCAVGECRSLDSLRSLGMTAAAVATEATTNGIAKRCMAGARARGKVPDQMPAATLALGPPSNGRAPISPDYPEKAGCPSRARLS